MRRDSTFRSLSTIIMMLFSLWMLFAGLTINAGEQKPDDVPGTVQEDAVSDGSDTPELTIYQRLDAVFFASDTLEKREQAMVELRGLLKKTPDDAALLWRAARMAWFIGDGLADDAGEKLERIGQEGMGYAERALKITPDSVEAHYYMALALSAYSRGISIVKALVKGLAGTYEQHLHWVLDRDKAFDRGGALRAIGRYYWTLPWPKYDYKKSIHYLDQALEVAPDVLRTHLYRGDTLQALKRYDEAKESYEYVLKTAPTDFDLKDAAFMKKEAALKLKKLIAERFSSKR